jgi:WD40 repeat protein
MWDVATGKAVWERNGTEDATQALAFSPDGALLAVGGYDGIVRLRKTESGEEVRQLEKGPGSVLDLVFAPDGHRLAASYGGGLTRLWDVPSGNKLRHFGYYYESKFAYSSAGTGYGRGLPVALSAKHIAIAAGLGTVCVYDAETGKELHKFKEGDDRFACLAFSADGNMLAGGGDGWMDRATTCVWSLTKGERLHRLSTPDLHTLAFSPDGATLYTAGNLRTQSWDATTGGKGQQFPTDAQHGRSAFSADGRVLAATSTGGAVRLWETATGKELHPLIGSTRAVNVVAFVNRTTLLTGGGGIRLWDLETARTRREFPGNQARVVHGQVIAWDYASVAAWEAASGRKLDASAIPDGSTSKVSVSPDGRFFATTYSGSPSRRPVRLYERAGARRLYDLQHERDGAGGDKPTSRLATIYATAFSPDGALLLTAGDSKEIVVWSVRSGRSLRRLALAAIGPKGLNDPARNARVSAVVFSNDGLFLAAANNADRSVHLWETVTWQKLGEFRVGAGSWFTPYALAFSPDSRSLAVTDGDSIALADVASLKVIRRLTGHRAAVEAVAFSPDGGTLASGSGDTTALVWDVQDLVGPQRPAEKLTVEQLDGLWTDLTGEAGLPKAMQAVRDLTARPEQTVDVLKRRLQPAAPAEGKQIARWIADLGSDNFTTRQKAEMELERLGEQAGPALRKAAAAKPALDALRRLEALLVKLEGGTLSAEQQRTVRALAVLERIGPSARGLLETLAGGAADAWLTEQARQTLQRLAERGADRE